MANGPENDHATQPPPVSPAGFRLGSGILQAALTRPYERQRGEPLYRALKIYTSDPAESILDGAVATVNVPYEPLEKGPVGRVLQVESRDRSTGESYRRVDLEHPHLMLTGGRAPSPSSPEFQQQMVYAVASLVYEAFRRALGRNPCWGFTSDHETTRLCLYPHAESTPNAWYDRGEGAIRFGYYEADDDTRGRNLPKGTVFTSLSHDIIVHEVTHALLDGLRSRFNQPSNGDVAGFHEGFADMIAIFQHFTHRDVVEKALRKKRGRLTSKILVELARQFGQTTRAGKSSTALRSAIQEDEHLYERGMSPHELGSVLTSAIFEAFSTVYRRKVLRFVELAQLPGTPPGANRLSASLIGILSEQARKIAGHFQVICIRAIDYCPPVDLRLGEYLRAMITADFDLVPSDPWGYREALVDAFRKRNIDPPGVGSLSEDALLWNRPRRSTHRIPELAFTRIGFDGDPGRPMSVKELSGLARALGEYVTRPENLQTFGLAPPSAANGFELPCVDSIRLNRRVSPDGDVGFDLVAEVTQKRLVSQDGASFPVFGGSTIILGPGGELRYAITRRVDSEERLSRQLEFLHSPAGNRLWERSAGTFRPRRNLFRLLC